MHYDPSETTTASYPVKRHSGPVFAWLIIVLALLGLFVHDAGTSANAQPMRAQHSADNVKSSRGDALILQSQKQSYALAKHALMT